MTAHWLIVDASLGGISMGVAEMRVGTLDCSHSYDAKHHKNESSRASQLSSPTVTWHAAHTDNGGSMAAIAGLFQAAQAHRGQKTFDGLVVAVGPGSFTGIKIGLAFAAGLIAGSGVPTIGVSGLEAAAAHLEQAVLLPSTRTHGFLAEKAGGSRLIDTDLAKAVLPPSSSTVAMVGDWVAGAAWLAATGKTVTRLTPAEVSRAAIYGMALEAAKGWPDHFKSVPPAPRYLRLSTAEEQLAQKGTSL